MTGEQDFWLQLAESDGYTFHRDLRHAATALRGTSRTMAHALLATEAIYRETCCFGGIFMKMAEKAALDELKHHCEKQGTALEDLKSSHANLSSDKSALDLHHATLKDSSNWKSLQGSPTWNSRLAIAWMLEQSLNGIRWEERVNYLESMMGDSADHHRKALEEHKANHAKLSNELRAREASHATLADRMSYIEQQMGDSFEKHAKDLAAAVAKMDAMHGRVSEERVAREAMAAMTC
eukprot:s4945_g4.t3